MRRVRKLLAIFIVILLWHLPINAANTDSDNDVFYPENIICESVNKIIKCARLPEYTTLAMPSGAIYVTGDYISDAYFADAVATDDENWSHIRNGIPIIGIVSHFYEQTIGPYYVPYAECKIISPFSAIFATENRQTTQSGINPAELCANVATNMAMTSEGDGMLTGIIPSALDDVCPDGFYTVPYETWCGDGMVNIADTPYCADDASGEYCLMDVTRPCNSGVSTINTSTGLSFSLYAKKYTEPALAVKYNDSVCWCNLELGASENAINIMFNDVVYHTVN